VPLFTSGGLGLGVVSSGLSLGLGLLVLRIWSCLHHCIWIFKYWTTLLLSRDCSAIL